MLDCFNCHMYLLKSVECLSFEFERAGVVVESRFKCTLFEFNEGFFLLVFFSYYCGLVHNAVCKNFAVEGQESF